MHCPGGNAPDPIWRVLAFSDGISSWTPLKPQHSNPNPNALANQLWYIDFLTLSTPLIIPHRLPAFLESLMPLKNWCSIHTRCSKSSLKHSILFYVIFPSLKQYFIAYRSSKVSDCIFEIDQQWQSGFSRLYSHCSCSSSFETEIIKISQSSHKIYSNNIVNFQESTTILNAPYEKSLETYPMLLIIPFFCQLTVHSVCCIVSLPVVRSRKFCFIYRQLTNFFNVRIFFTLFSNILFFVFFDPVTMFFEFSILRQYFCFISSSCILLFSSLMPHLTRFFPLWLCDFLIS